MISDKSIEVFVLAGGKSSRMGEEKGLMLLHNKPMIQYVLEQLSILKLPVQIIANADDYTKFGYDTLKDIIAEKGPMGGLLTAFHYAKSDCVLLISCDMPFITSEIVSKLIFEVKDDEITAAYVQNEPNPLFAVYKKSLKNEVEKRIAAGNLQKKHLIKSFRHKRVEMDVYLNRNPNLFINLNSKQDVNNITDVWN